MKKKFYLQRMIFLLVIISIFTGCNVFTKLNPLEWDNNSYDSESINYLASTSLQFMSIMEVSPDGKYIYVNNTNSLDLYRLENFDGYISNSNLIVNGDFGVALTISPDGKNLYYTNVSQQIVVNKVNNNTGEIYSSHTMPLPEAGSTCIKLECSPDGNYIYYLDPTMVKVWVYKRNYSDGSIKLKYGFDNSGELASPENIVVAHDSRFLYLSATDAFQGFVRIKIDINSGSLKGLDYPFTFDHAGVCAVSPDNRHLYLNDYSTTDLYLFDRNINTGKLSNMTYIMNYISDCADFEISNNGKDVFSINTTGVGNGNLYWYKRNINNGSLKFMNSYTDNLSNSILLEISPDDKYIFVGDDSAIHTYVKKIY